ncbi:hypothetical protein LTR62_008719 [Meristemomyces frigidus]|uniref:Enoyl reductase (ER) domain-containing protein n=1 Tax=Meristemomyces frigidus TaxID=1508187 RepID=A0AAN7YCG9_9PEZI|nr:hypothetical protein LTR62_008719 [Meristemomyces frigidus]
MHQAQVQTWGQAPRCVTVPELPPPAANESRIRVLAVAIHQVVRSRATGTHYSSGSLPFVPGVDGIGELVESGQKVYWLSMDTGCLAEYVNMPKRNVRTLPEGMNVVQAAAIVNPALSSWMAFQTRVTKPLRGEFSVLILGATSASGRVAITMARKFGAGRVVGVARNRAALESLGLDDCIVAADKAEETDFSKLGDVDVILDYVYGSVAVRALTALKSRVPTSYVHIGGLSREQDIMLPGAVLRSKNLTIRGSGPGAWAMHEVAESMDELLEMVKSIPEQPVRVAKFADVEKVWNEASSGGRLVFVP